MSVQQEVCSERDFWSGLTTDLLLFTLVVPKAIRLNWKLWPELYYCFTSPYTPNILQIHTVKLDDEEWRVVGLWQRQLYSYGPRTNRKTLVKLERRKISKLTELEWRSLWMGWIWGHFVAFNFCRLCWHILGFSFVCWLVPNLVVWVKVGRI